ncbi:MAG: hypothetical protein R2727_05130 [Bacteroidales bacterium]
MSDFAAFSGDRDKCMVARDKGSAGVLLVSGVKSDPRDEFEGLAKGESSVLEYRFSGSPGMWQMSFFHPRARPLRKLKTG